MNAASLGRPNTNPEFRLTLLACVALAFGTSWASARQCGPGWQPVESGWRANNWVRAATWLDPDGDGPEGEQLVIAQNNRNETAGSLPLLRWTGETWRSVGEGISGVTALTNDQGTLYAATGVNVRVLKAGAWNPIGTADNTINALAMYRGSLYAAGTFTSIGGTPCSRVARWDGTTWQPVGLGVNDAVASLLVFNDRLIVAGSFTSAGGSNAQRVAAWDGITWSALGEGLNNSVATLCEYKAKLVAGGSFSGSGSTVAFALAQYDGVRWTSIAPQVTGPVVKVASSGDSLYVAGPNAFGGTPAKLVARWDGLAWKPLDLTTTALISVLEARANDVFIGGLIPNAGDERAAGLFRLVNDQWRGVGLNAQGPARTAAKLSSGIYASFSSSSTNRASLARWNGTRWIDVFKPISGAINEVIEYHGDIVIAISTNGSAPGVLKWNGADWETLGTGMRGSAVSIVVYRDRLYALGTFTAADNAEVVARLDGSTWRPVGTSRPLGTWRPSTAGPNNLVVFNDRLYVAGGFTVATGGVGDGVAAWDDTRWANAGSPSLGAARKLAVHRGSLHVATSDRVWRRSQADWTALGGKFSPDALNGGVLGLTSTDRGLVAFGGIVSNVDAPAVPLRSIAIWDEASWQPLGSGSGDWIRGVVPDADELLAVGFMNSAGLFPADGWGVWTFTGAPTIGTQPSSAAAATNDDVALTIRIPDGYRDITAQWFHNGEPVRDGAAGAALGGGFVRGARTTIARSDSTQDISLVIERARYTDAGEYSVTVANECGEATSIPATLAVNCAADFNGDGFLSFEDFDAFIAAFETGQSSSDANADAFLSFEDVDAFVAAFEEGC